MITRLKITGFKSFCDFDIEFGPFTVVAGINASGKSNLFDALQLLSRLAETDLKTAFGEQRGDASELFTQFNSECIADEMSFETELLVNSSVIDNWGGEAKLKYTRLRYLVVIKRHKNDLGFETLTVEDEKLEKINQDEDTWMRTYILKEFLGRWRPKVTVGKRGKPYIYLETVAGKTSFKIPQDGKSGGKERPGNAVGQTVLSSINSVDFPHAFAAREEMRRWKFLQLNPEDLRKPSRQGPNMDDQITQTGQNMAAALYRISKSDPYALTEISRDLNQFLPNFTGVEAVDDKENRQFIIKVKNEDGREFTSRTLSEGTLRLLALCILLSDDRHQGLLCFEEPENGIHPGRIAAALKLLIGLSVDFRQNDQTLRQVIVNTHSPALVGETLKWKDDKRVRVWFSQLATVIKEFQGKRMKTSITAMFPVVKTAQFILPISETERIFTLAKVQEYLATVSSEGIESETRYSGS